MTEPNDDSTRKVKQLVGQLTDADLLDWVGKNKLQIEYRYAGFGKYEWRVFSKRRGAYDFYHDKTEGVGDTWRDAIRASMPNDRDETR